MTGILQHYLNPLHVYCRLVNVGFNTKVAKKIGKVYEKYFFLKIHLIKKGE